MIFDFICYGYDIILECFVIVEIKFNGYKLEVGGVEWL